MTSTHIEQIISLDDPRAADPDVAGTKAAMLARLKAAGYSVPDGFVVPTTTCGQLLVSIARSDTSNGDIIGRELKNELAKALLALDGGPVAVRSSATAEDLAGSSFAGQYETVLNVNQVEQLCEALTTCASSATSNRVSTYAAQVSQEAARIAVLVQRQVPADAAGIAFSANPVTGARNETLVSAVQGLGERLASGEATPDEWVVRDGTVECVSAPEQAIHEGQVREIAALADQLEAELGELQDIEWAIAGDRLVLLQARPITALPREPELDIPTSGTWMKDRAHYSEPVTPLGASIYLPLLNAGITNMFGEYGMLLERIENRSFAGEIYGKVTPVGGKEGPPPPWWVMGVLSRIVPPLRQRMKTAKQVFENGTFEGVVRRWQDEWRDEFRDAADRLRTTDLDTLDDQALEAHLDEAIALLERGQIIHFRLFPPYVVGVYELVRTCQELFGWEPLQALDLLAGLSEASSEPARALTDLAARIRTHPELDRIGVDGSGNLDRDLELVDPQLASDFAGYLTRYGHRSVNYDPGSPSLIERPQVISTLLWDVVANESEDLDGELRARREEAERLARETLESRSDEARARFEATLERAREVYPLREDNIFWTDNLPCGMIRRASLEAGRRLVARGQLRRPDDVAYVEIDELRSALQDDSVVLVDTALRRRAEQAWVATHPGPPFLGDEPVPPPDIRAIPDAGRRINQAFMWFMEQEFSPTPVDEADGLGGVPGSPGRFTGPARVITSEHQFDRLRPGDVLVAPVTTPVWSVLFGQAGAVVTDGGGTLSHAAIVAREHGIPAVLATGNATSELQDGEIVTVDGSTGRVFRSGS